MVALQERKTAILGGSSGIGLATARRLADQGAQVTIGGRDQTHLAEAVETLDVGARAIPVDQIPSRFSVSTTRQAQSMISSSLSLGVAARRPQPNWPSRTSSTRSRASRSHTSRRSRLRSRRCRSGDQ